MSVSPTLTIKQTKFVAVYLKDGNGANAYRSAYNAQNMSDGAVRVEACRLLQHPNVAQHIDSARKRVADKAEITQEVIIRMLIEDRLFAKSLKNASAATAASMGLAKVTGNLVADRANMRSPLQDWGTEELLALERMLVQRLADAPGAEEAEPGKITTH